MQKKLDRHRSNEMYSAPLRRPNLSGAPLKESAKLMDIVFTHHAMKRIEQRNISLSEVIECLSLPDKMVKKEDVVIFYKLSIDGKYMVFLICSIEKKECRIITVIKTSQVNRYL